MTETELDAWQAQAEADYGDENSGVPCGYPETVIALINEVRIGRTARNLLAEILTQTDTCIEQGGLYKYDDCVQDVFMKCFAFFHPEYEETE